MQEYITHHATVPLNPLRIPSYYKIFDILVQHSEHPVIYIIYIIYIYCKKRVCFPVDALTLKQID